MCGRENGGLVLLPGLHKVPHPTQPFYSWSQPMMFPKPCSSAACTRMNGPWRTTTRQQHVIPLGVPSGGAPGAEAGGARRGAGKVRLLPDTDPSAQDHGSCSTHGCPVALHGQVSLPWRHPAGRFECSPILIQAPRCKTFTLDLDPQA